MEITSLSSRGQVVIPQSIRKKMLLHEGEKFVVVGEGDTVMLKKMKDPFRDLGELMKRTRDLVKKNGVTPEDVEKAIQRVRKR